MHKEREELFGGMGVGGVYPVEVRRGRIARPHRQRPQGGAAVTAWYRPERFCVTDW